MPKNNDFKFQFSVRFSESNSDDDPCSEWANTQGNFNDAVRYLIQKDIAESGIRNLQLLIPASRGTVVQSGARIRPPRTQLVETVRTKAVTHSKEDERVFDSISVLSTQSLETQVEEKVSFVPKNIPTGYED
ncbi:MAG: hypothetical protein Q8N88_05700 [Nanoarchaeota archaeon]|nr:hypothetical protein [Nanoarchaeota archaeon]